ncbi:MAG: MFS transporter [Polyangiaceae bacterium]
MTETAAVEHPLTRRQGWVLALVATFTMAISYLDRQVLAVLAPTVTKALEISETNYGFLVAAFSVAYLFGSPIAGRWIDRYGARQGLLVAVLLWSIAAGSHALAAGFGSMFMLRIWLGLAESPSFPGAAQTVQRALAPMDRPRGLGVLFTGSSLGGMLAPPIANTINRVMDWRAAFLFTAVVGLIWVPLWLWVTRSSVVRELLTPRQEVQHVSPWACLKERTVWRAIAAVLALAPTVAFGLLWGSKLLVARFGIEQSKTTPYLIVPALLFDLGAVLYGDLAARRFKRLGPNPEGPRALFAVALLTTWCLALAVLGNNAWLTVILIGLSAMGAGGMMALLTGHVLQRVHPSVVSATGGITAAAQSLAYIVVNPAIGASVDATKSYDLAMIAIPAWGMVGGLVWLFMSEGESK